jgi:hypothetical protein
MFLHLFLSFQSFFFSLLIYLVEDDGEFVDGSGWLPCKLGWGPPELLAQSEVGDCWVWFLASDGADKKAVSSLVKAHRLLAILDSNSPSGIGTPFSSASSLSSVMGWLGGCSFNEAQMVSACIAMKSLLSICPVVVW